MRWLRRERIAPIHVRNGDAVSLLHEGKVLMTQPITEAGMFNVVGVVQLDEGDIGLAGGIAGVFGRE